MNTFNEKLIFEGGVTLNEDKRTVTVCALAPCLSKNNRYYSPEVVESASGRMVGLKSYADHEDRSVRNTIGKIVSEDFKDGKLYCNIKFSKARDVAEGIFTRIREGIITDVSIAAAGETKRVKMGEKYVEEVKKLDIKSVDFVSEGGVGEAKVLQVFESTEIPNIEEVKEVKMIENVEQLKKEYPDLIKALIKPLQEEMKTLKKQPAITEEVKKLREKLVSESTTTDKVKGFLKDRVSGDTEETIKASIVTEMAYIKDVMDSRMKIKAIDEKNKETVHLKVDEIFENKDISKNKKSAAVYNFLFKGDAKPEDFA